MRFEIGDNNYWETVECDDCKRKISHLDNVGWDGDNLCGGCSARRYQAHQITPCYLCKEPMGKEDFYYSGDEEVAHVVCVEKLSEEEQEDWYEPGM